MASFEVPPATQEAISLAGGKAFSDNAFKALVEAVFACLSDPKQDSSAHFQNGELSGVNQIALKQGFAGLSSVVLEAAKHDLESKQFVSSLEEHSLGSERAQYLVAQFDQHRQVLRGPRSTLASLGASFPRIIDVSYRLDYYIKSNSVERVDVPVFFVALKVQQPTDNSVRDVQFSASLQELQDLLAKLQDAAKNVERIYQKAE